MDYCRLAYGGGSTAGLVHAESGGTVILDHCLLTRSGEHGVYAGSGGRATVHQSTITRNDGQGIRNDTPPPAPVVSAGPVVTRASAVSSPTAGASRVTATVTTSAPAVAGLRRQHHADLLAGVRGRADPEPRPAGGHRGR